MFRSAFLACFLLVGCSNPAAKDLAQRPSSARILKPGCFGSPYQTIQSAINAASNLDVLEVCSGTYREHLTITGKTLTLRSREGMNATIIDGGNLGRALQISGGADVTIEGFTFTGGASSGTGGNVACSSSILHLTNNRISKGRASSGGGLSASACEGRVVRNLFEGNTGWIGGGIWVSGDLLEIHANTVISNDATYAGGGIYANGSAPLSENLVRRNGAEIGGGTFINFGYGEVISNRFEYNTSLDDGAGLYLNRGAGLVEDNTFLGNDASDEGGGLRLKLCTATVNDNLFIDNHADAMGGGAKFSHAASLADGNIFTGNTSWSGGGALVLEESASTLTNSLFEANESDDGGALYIYRGWDGVKIKDTVFVDNEARDDGGHIFIELPLETVQLQRTELIGGEADRGGAIYAAGSQLEIYNTVLRTNEADEGGALYLSDTIGTVTNSVLWHNSAALGAGVVIVNGLTFGLNNTIFDSNGTGATLTLIGGFPPLVEYNVFNGNLFHFEGMFDVSALFGNRLGDPGFTDPETFDFTLLPTSTLVDAGNPLIFDPDGSRSDIGRYGGPGAL